MTGTRRLWLAILLLAALSPLGLYLPELLRAGAAWGEWGLDEVRDTIGYAPRGMQELIEIWKAPLPDYALPGHEDAPLARRGLAYLFSALIGVGSCAAITYLAMRWLTRRKA
jgi:cobalt/nickel transport protein